MSADGPQPGGAARRRQVGRRARPRRLRARLDPDPRGDRARQDGGPREGHEAGPGLGGRDRCRGVRPHGAGDAHARHRLAAQRPVLLRPRLGRLHDRGACSGSASRRGRASSPTAPCKPALRRRRTWRSRRLGAPRRPWRREPVERLARTSTSAAPASPSAAPRRARRGAARTRSGPTSSASARELARSVEALRGRVAELTDWRRQIRAHQRELAIGAAVVGFAVGGLIALRRRR